MAVPKLPKNSFHKKWAGLSKSPALLFPAPRHAPAPCVHCSGQMLPHHRPRTAAMTFRVMPLCARPPCHLHRPTCREMCAADADEVCLPCPERAPPVFPLPLPPLLCFVGCHSTQRPRRPAPLHRGRNRIAPHCPPSLAASLCRPPCPPSTQKVHSAPRQPLQTPAFLLMGY